LGYLVVDLIADAGKENATNFTDRFTPQAKVIYALLCAYAFGGAEGKSDYRKLSDALNRSCVGHPNGLPNLSLAQAMYSKYRNNGSAKKLFSVHHWENTYLFQLFLIAKRNGKATHTDFIWLKPQDRILFYTLNTVGRKTPPVEAAAAFAMNDFEQQCAKLELLPLRMNKLLNRLEASICVVAAVDAFTDEFAHHQISTDDNDNWWLNLKTWSAAKSMNDTLQKNELGRIQREQAAARAMVQGVAPPPNDVTDSWVTEPTTDSRFV
jgi:hypothetical protein